MPRATVAHVAHLERRAFRERPNAAEALALDMRLFGDLRSPAAFGLFFDLAEPEPFDPSSVGDDGVAVLNVCGPLEHHRSWWLSYEEIVERTAAAFACDRVRAVVHRVDSPGGVVSGCGEAAKALLALRQLHDKPLFTYCDETAASAAYWIACASDEIWMPEAAQVGSIGVISCLLDETKALDEHGVALHFVTSGKRKADGQMGAAVTSDVLAVAQSKVDYLASLFFRAVARRRGLDPAAVKAFEAAVFHAPEAVKNGLADGVAGWAEFLDTIRATSGASFGGTRGPSGTARPRKDEAMKLLQAQQAVNAARAKVETASKALAKDATPENAEALAAALREKVAANDALAAATSAEVAGKLVTKKHTKHETLTEYEEDDPDAKDPEEEEEDAPDSERDPDASKPEKDEDAKALAAVYKAKGLAAHLAAYAPDRLLGACENALGVSGVREVFGALSSVGKRLAAADGLAAKLATSEGKVLKLEVNAIVARAQREGRTTGKEHRAELRALGVEHGMKALEAAVKHLPKLVRTVEDGALQAKEGEAVAVAGIEVTQDVEVMLASATVGMSPDEAKAFRERVLSDAAKSATGKAPTH